MCLAQIFGEARILALQLQIFFLQWIALGFRPAFPWSQRFEHAVGPLAPPIGQQRRVQSFATEQSANAAGCGGNRFGFLQDTLFVLRSEATALRSGNYFGIKWRDRPGAGRRFGCRCTSLRLKRRAFAPFRASQTPGRKNNTMRIPVHLYLFLSRPAH